jgi:manganese transport protein
MLVLLAPGFSSSVVGVMAGQAIMQGFVSFRIPLWLRRLVVIMPSFAVISAGIEITHALVLSQVVLSLGLPTRWWLLSGSPLTRNVMGEFANTQLTNAVAAAATAFVSVSALNAILLLGIAGLWIPLAGS